MKFLVCLTLSGCALSAQITHVAMDALMKIRYFPQQGSFMMAESIPVLFPPPGETPAKLIIKKAGGAVAVTKNMVIEPWHPHAAFGNLRAADGLVSFGPITAGDWVMAVEMNGKEISAYPFSVKAEKSADPFDPKTELVRTGPWNKTAILISNVKEGYNVDAAIWVSTREVPGGQPGKRYPLTIHVTCGAKQVGFVEGAVSLPDWTFYQYELKTGPGGGPLKWSALMNQAGKCALEYRVNGKAVRSYEFRIAGGEIAPLAQADINYAQADALPAQSVQGDTRFTYAWLAPIQ